MIPGPANAITDVPGIRVGHAEAPALLTGTTAVVPDRPATAAVSVAGGAPGTRGTTILAPSSVPTLVHAVVLSGGSAFGLDAAGGAMDWLRGQGVGFRMGSVRVPIVPSAILFDLATGPAPAWEHPPWWELGRQAAAGAARSVALGNAGAGLGAKAGGLKGGLGTASLAGPGFTVGAIAVANPLGSVTLPGSRAFWAWPFERGGEFGAVAAPTAPVADLDHDFERFAAGADGEGSAPNTTLAVVATDLALGRDETLRVAMMAQDGIARAIRPVHTPLDGDTVFVLATGAVPVRDPIATVARAGMMAADCVARAIARGVYEAAPAAGLPAWRDLPA
ncbi:MAG: P1 family peptidase [Pseudomonadota bacterium]